MILCENFRTASDKYGEVIAREALNSGIPDKYILAACRFHCEKPNKDFNILKVQFRQWMTYVVPNSNQDVNTMCYGEFSELLRETMAMYNTPNCLYNDGKWSLGYWNSFKEARMCPFNTKWCICHSQKDWIKYTKVKGSEFFVVNCNDKDIPMEFHHICVEIEKNGEIYFWNINDESTHCEHYPQYVSILPEHIKDIIWGESHRIGSLHSNTPYECQYQTNESKTMKYMKTNKRTITESQLRNIVAESVKKVLKESFYDDRKPFKAGELKQILSNVDDNDIIAVSISPEKQQFTEKC